MYLNKTLTKILDRNIYILENIYYEFELVYDNTFIA